MAEQATQAPAAEAAQKVVSRERSGILFPYSDLSDAVKIATGVRAVGGTSCQLDALAAHVGKEAGNSTFLSWLNAARIFGLVSSSQGTVTLNQLGTRICDNKQEQAAKVEAFLRVPLYLKVYEEFKGTTLPPPGGLDAKIVALGVPPKQKETARRTFQRSAEQAGFFAYGKDRLIAPTVKGVMDATPVVEEEAGDREEKPKDGNRNGGGGDGPQHPLIQGLIQLLPEIGADWALADRVKWLRAAVTNFDVAYKDSEETKSIKVSLDTSAN
jgi:hypothetical protein